MMPLSNLFTVYVHYMYIILSEINSKDNKYSINHLILIIVFLTMIRKYEKVNFSQRSKKVTNNLQIVSYFVHVLDQFFYLIEKLTRK